VFLLLKVKIENVETSKNLARNKKTGAGDAPVFLTNSRETGT